MHQTARERAAFTAALADLSSADLDRAGGKGANLGELVRAGFPVPPGFVITTAAYDQFIEKNQIDRVIARIAGSPAGHGVDGAVIRQAFEAGAIPAELEREILAAYRELGQGAVAVRSSATAEDLPGAAFAGQQETYLNILGDAALIDAVLRCWASLWGDRAIAYRERLGLDQPSVKLAVVVQKMVAADFAGVLFTANPVTGARDEIALDAAPGLGEAVVSGQVTPDHFILRRRRMGWQIAERRPGQAEVMIRALPGGGTEQIERSPEAERDVLPDAALRRLARLGASIQRHFGRPQDIEWAWAAGRPFILQARPMTALPEPPPRASPAQRLLATNFGEMIPSRPYPLDLDSWLPALSNAVEPIFDLLGLNWSLASMFEVEDHVILRFNTDLPHPTWRVFFAPLRLAALSLRYDPLRWQADPMLADALARARALESRDLRALSWEQLLQGVRKTRELPFFLAGEMRRRYFPRAVLAIVRLRLILGLMGRMALFSALLSGEENKTIEANQALERLADRVRADPDLARLVSSGEPGQLWAALAELPSGRAFLEDLQAFLDQYGHRETTISTALNPTWKDAPEVVLGIVKSFAAHPPKPAATKPPWQVARDELLQRRLLRLGLFRRLFLKTLAEARALLTIREDTHFYATLALPLFRRSFLEMGERLHRAGLLEAPEDVFHLTLGELEKINDASTIPSGLAAELRAAVQRRKQARAALAATPLVDPRLYPHALPSGDALLKGMPGSPGVAEGPARIVRDAAEFDRLAMGDVLVAPYTNPSWTPLFQRAAAVIVDSGSAASHAAIVAREYGLPAVMSTLTGTQALRDGQRVRVDGSRGLVFNASPQAGERDHQEVQAEEPRAPQD